MQAISACHMPVVAALHAASFERPWPAVEIAKILGMPGAFGFLAENAAGESAGFIIARCIAGESEILSVGVHPQAQGEGLGRSLMEEALRQIKSRGPGPVYLEVEATNTAALALYRSLGFESVGRRKDYYGRAGAGAADALVLRLSA